MLSVASFFEATITKAIHDFVAQKSKQNPAVISLVDNKIIKRQYHSFFNWDIGNTNQFLGLFGEDFKRKARNEIESKRLNDAEAAFLSIGKERNKLVHQNYIEIQINYTFEEIWCKYENAYQYVDLIIDLLSS